MAEHVGAGGILPQGESLRRALRWLDDRVREEPQPPRAALLAEAATRFDLTPAEEEFLLRTWVRGQ
ncbi:MAG TPA: hypothetical protein VM753_02425 [Anaeromyxobacter sp.]|jgi:hypothetical protein|nr:hypothetical protein [Anaeromyxobacter sp.]